MTGIKYGILSLFFLTCYSCKEEPEKPEPVKTDCYDRLTGEYLVYPDTDSSFVFSVKLIDTPTKVPYFYIENFNRQFDLTQYQFCNNNSEFGLNYSSVSEPYLDRIGHRFYIDGMEDEATELNENILLKDNTITFYYRLVNIAFYWEDQTEYVNDTLRQFARKIK